MGSGDALGNYDDEDERKVVESSVAAATATMVTAATSVEFVLGGQAAKFERFGDVLLDRMLHLVQFFLGVEETVRNRVSHQLVAMLLEIGDFFAAERQGHLLLLLQSLALVDQAVILSSGLVVPHERIDALADGLHRGLVEDGLAEFLGFLQDRRLVNGALHNQYSTGAGICRHNLRQRS